MPNLFIQATNITLTEDEVKKSLSPAAFEKIKGKQAVAYVIGEEGDSHPRVVGDSKSTLFRWPRSVIRRLADSVKTGTPFFNRHGQDNTHDGRVSLGEIVGAFTRNVGDKLQAVAIGLLNGSYPGLDVCSIEAKVKVDEGGIVGDVEEVSGVALSSSDKDNPAFPGAQRLAVLQCFDNPAGAGENHKPGETGKPGEGEKKMPTFEEVKTFIREHNVFPNQLYDMETMKTDRVFGPALAEGSKAKEDLVARTKELDDAKKANTEAVRKVSEATAKDQFAKLIPEGATDKQKAFYLKRFDPSKLEKLDETSLKAYIENEAKEFADYAKAFGVEITPPDGGSKKKEGSTESGDDPVEAALQEVLGVEPNA